MVCRRLSHGGHRGVMQALSPVDAAQCVLTSQQQGVCEEKARVQERLRQNAALLQAYVQKPHSAGRGQRTCHAVRMRSALGGRVLLSASPEALTSLSCNSGVNI